MTQMIVDYDQLKLRPKDERLRKDVGDLSDLVASLKLIGQIHDIIVDENWFVRIGTRKYLALGIAGIKKVKIDKRDGLTEEEWIIMEAHENLKRKDLDPVEEALTLVKAKEAYEKLHPETKRHTIGGITKAIKKKLQCASDKLSVVEKNSEIPKLPTSFTKNIAKETGFSERTISRKVELGQAIQEGRIKNDIVKQLEKKEISPYKVMRNLKDQNSELKSRVTCKDCKRVKQIAPCPHCMGQVVICQKESYFLVRKSDANPCDLFL